MARYAQLEETINARDTENFFHAESRKARIRHTKNNFNILSICCEPPRLPGTRALAQIIEKMAQFAKTLYFLATYHALTPKYRMSVNRAPGPACS
ncbi:hypothetical protein QMO17_28365, partial [Klebsiella pneumoniae]|nr:hypothetical protein [Klebsiella pneumoniae]